MKIQLVSQAFRALVFFLFLGFCSVYAQRPAGGAADTVRELSRIDMNRAVELQILPPNKSNAVREAIQKQISDDFRDLQALNNKLMADAWARPELDYKYISGMAGQISKKAARLRSNLGLPRSKDKPEKKSVVEIASAMDFRKELLTLDRTVMSFVTNPIFLKANIVELNRANQASRDLNAVVDLSDMLKKAGERLSKIRAKG